MDRVICYFVRIGHQDQIRLAMFLFEPVHGDRPMGLPMRTAFQ